MDLHTETYTFQKLLINKKTYVVPRYQREFSWGKPEIEEFYYDVFNRLVYDKDTSVIKNTEYFFGNILLEGDMVGSNKELFIIDGQQRLTALTIFLSTIARMFSDEGEQGLKDAVWQYIISQDDDGEPIAVIRNSTPYPFFQYKIQSLGMEVKPSSEEEDRINYANNYFEKKLNKKALTKDFKDYYNADSSYIDILKALRDQILQSYVICSWTSDKKYANLVFEIMNAKGKELETIDLVKNTLFEKLNDEIPADFAREEWKIIHDNLVVDGSTVPLSTFYRHFWYSQYGNGNSKKIWRATRKMLSTKEKCKEFLLKMDNYSKAYKKIISPSLSDFGNRKELRYIVIALNTISKELCVDMPRILLLSAFEKYSNELITTNEFGSLVKFIERFHFIYNGLFSLRTNRLAAIYCDYSKMLNDAMNKKECISVINGFKTKLRNTLPNEQDFINKVKELTYTRNDYSQKNILSKRYLNEVENILSNRKNDKEDSSVEHMLNEDEKSIKTLRIDRLMLLEQDINNSIPKVPLFSKLPYYKQSKYAIPNQISDILSTVDVNQLDEKLDILFKENAAKFYKSIN